MNTPKSFLTLLYYSYQSKTLKAQKLVSLPQYLKTKFLRQFLVRFEEKECTITDTLSPVHLSKV